MNGTTAMHGCRLLEWDTHFFGRRIARLTLASGAAPDWPSVAAWCQAQAVECLYFLCPASDPAMVRDAEQNHFRLVDIRLTLEHQLDIPRITRMPTQALLRPAAAADLPTLKAIARTSHRNTRFFRDGKFPVELCEKFYETWIENSFCDPTTSLWVAEVAGQPAGYCTGQCNPDGCGRNGLIAVDAAYRRLGLGQQLILQRLAWLREQGMTKAQVVTQGGCVASQQFYQKCGFVTVAVELWYHKWFTDER